MNSLWQGLSSIARKAVFSVSTPMISNVIPKSFMATLQTMHHRHMQRLENPKPPKRPGPLGGKPFAKGLVLKTLIKKPRKPNSANRKCVLVRLSTGREMFAFVPGIGHNLQEHQMVLCRGGRLKDTPGVKIRCVRGKYDLPHVKPKGK